MELKKKVRLGDLLVQKGLITEEQLKQGLQTQKKTGKKLGETLVEEGLVNDEALAGCLSNQMHIELVDPMNIQIEEGVRNVIQPSVMKKLKVIPLYRDPENPMAIVIAMADPMDLNAIDDISIITNSAVVPTIATQRNIMLAIDKNFGSQSEVQDKLTKFAEEKASQMAAAVDESEVADINSSPIVLMVNEMIEQAVRKRSSDIHIEALETTIRVRFRIDGALQIQNSYPAAILPSMIARIKIISGLDIAEKRKPQDGRATYVVDGSEYDIRVSILPTVYGEKVVMRLTGKMALTREKSMLGFKPNELKVFDHILQNPHGIILVTGPTGSGKSTTLYTALSELNKPEVNIITVEDPVEANINGLNQVQTNNKAGLTFASALRSILRQDPDIIMIGEIRDGETASIAVQASITGHLVVSTLHTNSAAATITRLTDMGLEPYLIADSVVGIIAQRLVRRLCPHCKQIVELNDEQRELMMVPKGQAITAFGPKGCSKCDNTGYRGRIGVYEIMEMSPALKKIVSHNGDADAIKEKALEEGMNTLRMSAAAYVLDGITSFDEMMRVSFEG